MANSLRGFLRLTRASIALSPVADGLAGIALGAAVGASAPPVAIGTALAASLCLFLFGMAANDLADREEDRARAMPRPIPEGAVSVSAAKLVVTATGTLAIGLASVAGRDAFVVAAAILVLIAVYDFSPRHLGLAGPFVLGSIRALNLTLGAAAVGAPLAAWPAGAAYFGYIVAVGFLGRMEDGALGATRARVRAATVAAVTCGFLGPLLVARGDVAALRVLALACSAALAVWLVVKYRALVREPIVPGARLARFVGAALSALFAFDAALAAQAGATVTAVVVLLMFPVSRALVRALPPS